MSPYFVVLMLMALAYSVSAQGEGNTTAAPGSTESSSSLETTTVGVQNNTIPQISPVACPVNEILSQTECGCLCEQSCGSIALQRPIECRIFILGRPACTFMRQSRECCVCQRGYLRNLENRCVLPVNCSNIL